MNLKDDIIKSIIKSNKLEIEFKTTLNKFFNVIKIMNNK